MNVNPENKQEYMSVNSTKFFKLHPAFNKDEWSIQTILLMLITSRLYSHKGQFLARLQSNSSLWIDDVRLSINILVNPCIKI